MLVLKLWVQKCFRSKLFLYVTCCLDKSHQDTFSIMQFLPFVALTLCGPYPLWSSPFVVLTFFGPYPLWSIPFVVCTLCVDKHLVFTLCGSYPLWSLPFVVATLCGPQTLCSLYFVVLKHCGPYPLWSVPFVLTNTGSKSTIPAGRSGRVVGWLDNMGIRLNSAPIGVGVGWGWG